MNDDMKNENNQEQKEKEDVAAPLQKNVCSVAAARNILSGEIAYD